MLVKCSMQLITNLNYRILYGHHWYYTYGCFDTNMKQYLTHQYHADKFTWIVKKTTMLCGVLHGQIKVYNVQIYSAMCTLPFAIANYAV